jgi:hypothetical protein
MQCDRYLLSCVRPKCDNLDDGIRGASSSTFISEEEIFPPPPPPLLSLLLLGVNVSDDFSNFQSYDKIIWKPKLLDKIKQSYGK